MRKLIPWVLALALGAAWWASRRPSPTDPAQALPIAPQWLALRDPESLYAPPERVSNDRSNTAAAAAAAPAAGAWFEAELTEDPAAAYGHPRWTEADRKYAEVIAGIEGATYDPLLGHAARELAAFYALEGELAPSRALWFFINAAGAAEWTVHRTLITTGRTDDAAIAARVEALATERPEIARVGIGEAYTIARPPVRTIAICTAGPPLALDRVSRTARPGSLVALGGVLPAGLRAPAVLVMTPALEIRPVEVATRGARFEAQIDVGRDLGAVQVEILAEGDHGPQVLAQLELWVGEPPPLRLDARWPPDEAGITSDAAAEAFAFELLQTDRADLAVEPLRRDPALDRVARGHSQEMRDRGYFGHRSPTSGQVGDRLAAAGYRTLAHGENLAQNGSLWDAQDGLFHSLGHRQNILGRQYTHVGIGVALSEQHGQRIWTLTQVFARPARKVQLAETRERVLEALQAAREQASMAALEVDPGLLRAAAEAARAPDPTPAGALEAARDAGLARGGGVAIVQRVGGIERLEVPPDVLSGDYARVGAGVFQDWAGDDPRITVVLILGPEAR